MKASRFIARRLGFEGKLTVVSITVSFLVIIIAVAVSSGFRKEVDDGIATMVGDLAIYPQATEDGMASLPSNLACEGNILMIPGVRSIEPVVTRGAVVKAEDVICGVTVKGIEGYASQDNEVLDASIPSRLALQTGLQVGDDLPCYFISDKVRARKFRIREILPDGLELSDNMTVICDISTMRRLNGWNENTASSLQIVLDPSFRTKRIRNEIVERIGMALLFSPDSSEQSFYALSPQRQYPQLYDWLNLLDMNVAIVLILMIIVAGFNMISGLLIMIFRNISTVGLLKAFGMCNRDISGIFMRLSAKMVFKAMAAGNILAILLCFIQDKWHILKLDPVNYFVSFVPVSVNLPLVFLADALAFVAILLILNIPLLFISRIDPATTVRYK